MHPMPRHAASHHDACAGAGDAGREPDGI